MSKIETIEQLIAEQERLKKEIRGIESEIKGELDQYSQKAKKLLVVIDKASNGVRTIKNGLNFLLGVIANKRGLEKSTSKPLSGWTSVGLMAIQLLADSEKGQQVAKKVKDFISPKKRHQRHRKKRRKKAEEKAE